MITLVAARSRNGVIGKDGGLPWHIPEELKFFQKETLGSAIIMGRKTWESLPVKPLKKRLNIVITSSSELRNTDGVKVCSSPEEALTTAANHGYSRINVIGGEQVFKSFMGRADRILLTEVDMHVDEGNVFFPDISDDEWSEESTGLITQTPLRCMWRLYTRTNFIQE